MGNILSMSSACQNKEAAWEFIRSLIKPRLIRPIKLSSVVDQGSEAFAVLLGQEGSGIDPGPIVAGRRDGASLTTWSMKPPPSSRPAMAWWREKGNAKFSRTDFPRQQAVTSAH